MLPAWLVFSILILAAVGVACWPVLRERGASRPARLLLAGAIAALVFGIGAGSYLILGHPELAARSFTPVDKRDYSGAVAALARTMSMNRNVQSDPRGWMLLARAYAQLGDERDAAAAYRRGITTMVGQLEMRLQRAPNDPNGWQQLIRSEVVLGDEDRARSALARARKAMAQNPAVLAALGAEARELKLDK
jgi:cytochrome c-type biogenesis protein CcmH/NrfG